jgi:hypothetical protein
MLRERAIAPRVAGGERGRSREQIRAGGDFLAAIVSVFWANEMIFVFMKKIIRVFGKGFVLLTTLSVYRLEPYLGNSIPQGFQNPRVPQPPYPARGRKPRPRTKIENSLAPTSRSSPEGLIWGELNISKNPYRSKSPRIGGFRGPVDSVSCE